MARHIRDGNARCAPTCRGTVNAQHAFARGCATNAPALAPRHRRPGTGGPLAPPKRFARSLKLCFRQRSHVPQFIVTKQTVCGHCAPAQGPPLTVDDAVLFDNVPCAVRSKQSDAGLPRGGACTPALAPPSTDTPSRCWIHGRVGKQRETSEVGAPAMRYACVYPKP